MHSGCRAALAGHDSRCTICPRGRPSLIWLSHQGRAPLQLTLAVTRTSTLPRRVPHRTPLTLIINVNPYDNRKRARGIKYIGFATVYTKTKPVDLYSLSSETQPDAVLTPFDYLVRIPAWHNADPARHMLPYRRAAHPSANHPHPSARTTSGISYPSSRSGTSYKRTLPDQCEP